MVRGFFRVTFLDLETRQRSESSHRWNSPRQLPEREPPQVEQTKSVGPMMGASQLLGTRPLAPIAEGALVPGTEPARFKVSSTLCTCRVQSCAWSTTTLLTVSGDPGNDARSVHVPSVNGV